MEDASKALLMAGGMLIGLLVVSLGVFLFADFAQSSSKNNEQVLQAQLVEFNGKFTSYDSTTIDSSGKTVPVTWNIYDIISIAGFARENNKYYEDNSDYQVQVIILNSNSYFSNKDIVSSSLADSVFEGIKKYLIDQDTEVLSETGSMPEYTCNVLGYNENNGRVKGLKFSLR